MRLSILVFVFSMSLQVALADTQLVPHEVVQSDELGTVKLSLDVEVPLVDERLPSKEELGAISRHLVDNYSSHERTFILFYLPGMEVGAGAYATAHHDPTMEVNINEFVLLAYPEYQDFVD